MHAAVGPQPDLLALAHAAVDDARQNDDAAVGIEPGIEDQRAQRRVRRALGRRHPVHDRFENLRRCRCPFLALTSTASLASRPITLLDLLANALGLGRRQIDLVDDRNDFQIVMQRQVGVGQRLRFDALRRVHHQQRAFAGLQAARNFVA